MQPGEVSAPRATARPTAEVDHYVVTGNPVAHSQSPFIHAMFARATGQALRYGRLLCADETDAGYTHAVRAFAASHGGAVGDYSDPPFADFLPADASDNDLPAGAPEPTWTGPARGCNITVPFKFVACRLGERRSERATLAQAANLLRFDADGWFADNTDGAGLVRDIEHHAATPLAGGKLLLVGAGGAAAGALGPLIAARPAELVLCNRTANKAQALVARHAQWAAAHGVRLTVAPQEQPGSGFDVVVNASASSLQAGAIPVPATVLRDGCLALDMMYGNAALPFIAWATAHGARGRDGLGMLVEQAAEAFFVWRGV
jgi:shikimate dehydrogenase